MNQASECSADRGREKTEWIICTDVGGKTFLHDIAIHVNEKCAVVIWCANMYKAKRFNSLGDLAQAFSLIPEQFEAYEMDTRFIDWSLT